MNTSTPRPPAIEIANRFTREAPVDLVAMASAMSIALDMDADLPPDVSGKIICREMGGNKLYSIEVNRSHSVNRKRFTLAHEIAHFVLHRHLMQGGITDNAMYRSGLSDDVEREANRFAGELLMPATLVRDFWRQGCKSLSILSKTFGASEDAMRIRLRQLGYGA